MYCRRCGKEIAEDSAFCQYCGGQLQEEGKHKFSSIKRFQSLSRNWQICIMCYVVWFLAGICVLIGLGPYGCEDYYCNSFSEVLWPVLLVVVVVPVSAFFFWYYLTHLKKEKKKKPKSSRRKTEKKTESEKTKKDVVVDIKMFTYPLMDFAKLYGKMLIKTVANPTTNEVHSYCVFTNEHGIETEVQFSQKLGPLRPQEIAAMKERLVVVQKKDGFFELQKMESILSKE